MTRMALQLGRVLTRLRSSWHVRNASLLLYAALIQRVFGQRKEHVPLHRRISSTTFFAQFRTLHPVLVQQLRDHHQHTTPEALGSVFSTLLLLSLIQTPNNGEEARAISQPFLQYVESCSRSPVWKVREAAATAMTGLIPADRTWSHAQSSLQGCSSGTTENGVGPTLRKPPHSCRV